MKHLTDFSKYMIKESLDSSEINPIIYTIKNTDAGKLLQRLLGVGTKEYLDFDYVFQEVKTGRVYIKSYGGSPRIYRENNKWCFRQEASGNVYGEACYEELEDLIKYAVRRYVVKSIERGISKDDIDKWMDNNWDLLYTFSSYKEILDEYKKSTGISMITDRSVLKTLDSFKKLNEIYKISISDYTSVGISLNPWDFESPVIPDRSEFDLFLSNRETYSRNFDNLRGRCKIVLGTSDIDVLDKKFSQSIEYFIDKKYDHKIKKNFDPKVYQYLLLGKMLCLYPFRKGDDTIYDFAIKLYHEYPIEFSIPFKAIENCSPDIAQRLEDEIGKENLRGVVKGSSLLRKFGLDED